jgi:hypothetical protein
VVLPRPRANAGSWNAASESASPDRICSAAAKREKFQVKR